MYRGMYTAASGLMRMQRRQEVIAQNLANATTTGHRADLVRSDGFVSVLQESLNGVEPASVRPPFIGGWIGETGTGVKPDDILIDRQQGSLRETGNPLDVALGGPGFFVVQTPDGEAYTRDGTFRLNAQGQLVNGQGYPVLGANGPITLPNDQVTISGTGVISQNGQALGQLRVVDFPARFDVQGANGIRPLAAGAYTLAADGTLSSNGQPVTRLAGNPGFSIPSAGGPLTVQPGDLQIGADGALTQNGQALGVLPKTPGITQEQAAKPGGNLLTVPEGAEAPSTVEKPLVRQATLENSNVDVTRSMTDMLAVLRSYEASQRALKLNDEAAQRAVNDVGRLNG